MRTGPPSLQVHLLPESFTIDGKVILPDQQLPFFQSTLGPPDRTIAAGPPAPVGHRNNHVHLYDRLGLYLNEHHATREIQAVSFVWNLERGPFPPRNPFCGTIRLGETIVEPSVSYQGLLNMGFQRWLGSEFSLRYGRFYVSTQSRNYRRHSNLQLEGLQVSLGLKVSAMSKSLQRFIDAHDQPVGGYSDALAEIRTTGKRTHWIWYIFPQLSGLGHSHAAREYALQDVDEGNAYMKHPVLGARLLEISQAVAARLRGGVSLIDLMGSEIDALKLISSVTLFSHLAAREPDHDALAETTAEILMVARAQGLRKCQYTLNVLEVDGG